MTRPRPAAIIDGEPWWAFLYEYDWEGARYGFEIRARSREEADARLKRLPLARYLGQMDGESIPANAERGIVWLYVCLKTWWRNLLR